MNVFYYILNLFIISTLCLSYYKKSNQSPIINYFWIGLFIKLGFTVFVGHYYAIGDSWQIFKCSLNMNSIYEMDSFLDYWKMIFYSEFKSDYWKHGTIYWGNPRALLLMKIVSLLNIITGKNYWIISIYLSVFSYFGIFYLLKNLCLHYTKLKYASIFCLLFLPSVVFNSSGIVKETLAFGSICFILGFVIQVNLEFRKINFWSIFGMLIGLLLLYKLKYYYLAVLLPSLFLYFLINFTKQIVRKKKLITYFFGFLILIGLIFSSSSIHENLSVENFLIEITRNYKTGVSDSAPGQYIIYREVSEDYWSLIKNTPKAMLYGWFGPFIWESKNLAMFYISIENLLLLIATMVFIYRCVLQRVKFSALEWSLLFYAFCLAIILPLSSPNFGTLTRFKVSYFPFLCLIILGNISFVDQFLNKLFDLNFRKK